MVNVVFHTVFTTGFGFGSLAIVFLFALPQGSFTNVFTKNCE